MFCHSTFRLYHYVSLLVPLDNSTFDTLQSSFDAVICRRLLQLSRLDSAQKPCTILAREHSLFVHGFLGEPSVVLFVSLRLSSVNQCYISDLLDSVKVPAMQVLHEQSSS